MNLKYVMLSEKREPQKITYCMILFYDILEKTKLLRPKINQWSLVIGERDCPYKGAVQRNLGSDGIALYIECGDSYTTICFCQNS